MGGVLSNRAANDAAEAAQTTIDAKMKSFQDKRDLYLIELSKSRGDNAENTNTEVTGGRTVMEYSNIYYTQRIGANSEITDAIGDFFSAADQAIDSDKQGAKHSAIKGAKSLITAAIEGILGDTSIGAREIKTFNVLYMNQAFVRIDYIFYQENIDVVKYLSAVRSTARLIVCEVAVLPVEAMKPAEITYLLSQSYDFESNNENPNLSLARVGKLQTNLIQLSVLTKMLQNFLVKEDEELTVDGPNIEARSKALIALSKNVDDVLVEIEKGLPPPDNRNDIIIETRSPAYETELRDHYDDAELNGKGMMDYFVKAQKQWLVSNKVTRMGIKEKAIEMMKLAHIEYSEAFQEVFEGEKVGVNELGLVDGTNCPYKKTAGQLEGARGGFNTDGKWSDSYRYWYGTHKVDFAMWWFEFLLAAKEITAPFQVTEKDDKGMDVIDESGKIVMDMIEVPVFKTVATKDESWSSIIFNNESYQKDPNSAYNILKWALNKLPKKKDEDSKLSEETGDTKGTELDLTGVSKLQLRKILENAKFPVEVVVEEKM